MSHVAVCAHVVMNAEHDCGEGDKECVAWPQCHLSFGTVSKGGIGHVAIPVVASPHSSRPLCVLY